MKILLLFLTTLLFTMPAFSQDAQEQLKEPPRLAKNFFYLSPFNLIAGQFQIGYERDFNNKHGILLLPSLIINDDYYIDQNFGATAEVQYRYHIVAVKNPREKAKNDFRFNFYMAPFAQFQYLEYDDYWYYDQYGNYVSGSNISRGVSGGILFGTRFVFFERFSIDAYAGGGVKYSPDHNTTLDYYYSTDIFRPNYTGIIGKANLQVGLAF